MMTYIANIAEAIIAAFVLYSLCDIKHRSFLIVVTFLTFILEYIGDYFSLNDLPLLFSYLIGWFIIAVVYDPHHFLQKAFVVILNNLIIDIGAIIAIILFVNISISLMMCAAKLIQLILSVGLIKYYHHFSDIKSRYWMPVLASLVLSLAILDLIMNIHFTNDYHDLLLYAPWLTLGVIALTLSTLVNLEHSNNEIKKATIENNNLKNKQITYDLMNHTRHELIVLRHELTYDMMLIEQYLKNNDQEEALTLAKDFIKRVGTTSQVFTTSNPILDTILSLKLNDLSMVTTMINIPYDDFYNRIEVINLLLSFLDLKTDKNDLGMTIKDNQDSCIVQFTGNYQFIHKKEYESVRQHYSHIIMSYELSSDPDFSIMRIKLDKHYYEAS